MIIIQHSFKKTAIWSLIGKTSKKGAHHDWESSLVTVSGSILVVGTLVYSGAKVVAGKKVATVEATFLVLFWGLVLWYNPALKLSLVKKVATVLATFFGQLLPVLFFFSSCMAIVFCGF